MSLVKSIRDCLLEYHKAVLDICEAAEGFEASTAYSNKLAVLKKLDLAVNQEISKSVEEALEVLRGKLLAWDVEFNPKYLYGSGEKIQQSYTYQLNLLVEAGEDQYSPRLSERDCLDAFLDKVKTEVLSE